MSIEENKIKLNDPRFWKNVLIEAIDDFTYRKTLDHETISVTEIAGCLRKAFYQRLYGVEIDTSDIIRLTGTLLHSIVEKKLEEILGKQGAEIMTEVHFDSSIKTPDGKEVKIGGQVDAITPNAEIIELKFTNKAPDEPYPSHVRQVAYYMYEMYAEKAHIVYFETANSFRIRVFTIKREPEEKFKKLIEEMKERAITLAKSLECAKRLREAGLSDDEIVSKCAPPRERGPLCNYCPFRLICLTKKYNGKSLTNWIR